MIIDEVVVVRVTIEELCSGRHNVFPVNLSDDCISVKGPKFIEVKLSIGMKVNFIMVMVDIIEVD